MIVVAIIGILAAVAVPAFMKYIKKSKTTEARQFVKKIYDGARAYYMDQNYQQGMTFSPMPKQFPTSAPFLTPSDPTACCEKCAPDAALWTDETWVVLQFSVDDPHYYSYQYVVSGSTSTAIGQAGTTETSFTATGFTARAHGDLDCDGTWSTFEMYGTVNSIYSDGPAGNAGIFRHNELE